MQIFTKIEALKAFLRQKRANKQTIGLVPTMGALHAGHLFLVESSKAENQVTVGTVYVNPTQFNNASDLDKYPRSIESDMALLEKGGCDALFNPDNQEMYAKTSTVKIEFGDLDKILEGKFRPGHFSGVALVVSKLFNIVQPDIAYFGQKDFQQFKVISRLVEELKFGVRLRCIPTLREPDGLAMSSRNLRLNEEERQKAIILFQSLSYAKEAIEQGKAWPRIREDIQAKWDKEKGIKLDYVELADQENLILLDNVKDATSSIMLMAGFVGEVRLIDNMMVGQQ
ncbi:MAG TPA: pantoate--beta-alanine ligase [Cyclobacteriaceae bacterium]|nr:pantoate--beta-alanine ligase [Cyclobacteriaceae bacterium]